MTRRTATKSVRCFRSGAVRKIQYGIITIIMKKISTIIITLAIPLFTFGQTMPNAPEQPKRNYYMQNPSEPIQPTGSKPSPSLNPTSQTPAAAQVKNGGTPNTGKPTWRLPNITNQEELDGLRKVLEALQNNKIDMGKAKGIITVVPAPRAFNVTILGVGKNNGLRVPTSIHMWNIPRSNPTVPDADYFNLFQNAAPNPSVDTPPADTGGLGSPPGAVQPPDFAIGLPPIPVSYWGLPNPQTIFPKVTPDGFAFILNFNPYQVTSMGLGGTLTAKYSLGVRGSEMVIVFSDPEKDGTFTAHFYTLDPSKPNGVGIVFADGEEFVAYALRQGYIKPSTTFFGNPIYNINSNGDWRFPGLKYYAIVDTVVPNKNGTFSLLDKLGNQIGTTVKTGTATIKNNPNATFWMYYNLKTGKYVLKVIDSTLQQR